jgi:hypothetical protein
MKVVLVCVVSIALLSGCSVIGPQVSGVARMEAPSVTLPLVAGWFNNKKYYYINTDAWPQSLADEMGVNYAPRLADSLPPRPKPPGLKTIIERVYTFPENDQINILPSVPEPIGPASTNRPYSPIWQPVAVRWLDKERQRELRSEADVLDAEAEGWVSVTVINAVVNCAVIADDEGNWLPGSQLHWN